MLTKTQRMATMSIQFAVSFLDDDDEVINAEVIDISSDTFEVIKEYIVENYVKNHPEHNGKPVDSKLTAMALYDVIEQTTNGIMFREIQNNSQNATPAKMREALRKLQEK